MDKDKLLADRDEKSSHLHQHFIFHIKCLKRKMQKGLAPHLYFEKVIGTDAAKGKSKKGLAPHLCLAKAFGTDAAKGKQRNSQAPHLYLAKAIGTNAAKGKKETAGRLFPLPFVLSAYAAGEFLSREFFSRCGTMLHKR